MLMSPRSSNLFKGSSPKYCFREAMLGLNLAQCSSVFVILVNPIWVTRLKKSMSLVLQILFHVLLDRTIN